MLHLDESEVASVLITNPIVLGKTVTDKEFRLDINVILNSNILINLEMQISNKLNWQERSVMYLCRSFDQLKHGQDYGEARSAIHIGFLDYTLFKEYPEFYATYKLINVKTHQIYSDNIALYVVDLSRIEHEQVIAQTKEKYERILAEQSQQIALLRAENEQLKKQQ